MPQMMPISWLSLCAYSIMVILLIVLHLYFNVCDFNTANFVNKFKPNFYFILPW